MPELPETNGQTNGRTDSGVEEGRVSSPSSEKEKLNEKKTIWEQVQIAVFNSWINLLLFCVPIGIALHYAHVNS